MGVFAALMMLYENPNNANMWLSDPDTHPVVSQIIRIYHAEKHSLGRPPPPDAAAAAAAARESPNHSSITATSTASHPSLLRTTPTFTPLFSSQGQTQGGNPFMITIRNNSGVGGAGTGSVGTVSAGWLGGPPLLRSSPSMTPPRTQPTPPAPATVLRSNPEEPMSHSGSPVRRPQGGNVAFVLTQPYQMDLNFLGQRFGNSPPVTLEDSSSANAVVTVTPAVPTSSEALHQTPVLMSCPTTNLMEPNTRSSPATISNDVEMDDTVGDSQDMDTQ